MSVTVRFVNYVYNIIITYTINNMMRIILLYLYIHLHNIWMYRRSDTDNFNILTFLTRILDRFRNENKIYYWHSE